MSLKENTVILYFDSHPYGGEFIKQPILDLYSKEIKSLLVEDARGLSHEEYVNTRFGELVSDMSLPIFYQGELDLYTSLLTRQGEILSAEFAGEPKSDAEDKFYDQHGLPIQELAKRWDDIGIQEKLNSLKEYFNEYTQYIFLNRELRMITNIDIAKKPCLLRVGVAHSLMKERIDKTKYTVKTILQTMHLLYSEYVARKIIRGSEVTNEELMKGFICLTLNAVGTIMLELNGKHTTKGLDHKDALFGNLFFNCIADQIIDDKGIEFTHQDILETVSPLLNNNGTAQKETLKKFLKNHSINKYGSLVFYDWAQKQGFTRFED